MKSYRDLSYEQAVALGYMRAYCHCTDVLCGECKIREAFSACLNGDDDFIVEYCNDVLEVLLTDTKEDCDSEHRDVCYMVPGERALLDFCKVMLCTDCPFSAVVPDGEPCSKWANEHTAKAVKLMTESGHFKLKEDGTYEAR